MLFLNLSAELRPQNEKKRANQISIGAAPHKCRLLHKIFEIVANLAESMVGLHFLYIIVSMTPRKVYRY